MALWYLHSDYFNSSSSSFFSSADRDSSIGAAVTEISGASGNGASSGISPLSSPNGGGGDIIEPGGNGGGSVAGGNGGGNGGPAGDGGGGVVSGGPIEGILVGGGGTDVVADSNVGSIGTGDASIAMNVSLVFAWSSAAGNIEFVPECSW